MKKKPAKSSKAQSQKKKSVVVKKQKAAKKTTAKVIRVPITNYYDGNDFSAQIFIGSKNVAANVLLDTGSSTLAVTPKVYNAAKDSQMKPTALLQQIQYGTGGWAGPVVNTSVSMGLPHDMVTIPNANIAVTQMQQKGNFDGVDGILGLAYSGINDAYNLKPYFTKK